MTLNKLKYTELIAICTAFKVPIKTGAHRQEICDTLLAAAGYKVQDTRRDTRSSATEPTPTATLTDLENDVIDTTEREIELLRAIANGLQDLQSIITSRSAAKSPAEVAAHVQLVLQDLRYYSGHSNLKHLAVLYHILNPHAKLDL